MLPLRPQLPPPPEAQLPLLPPPTPEASPAAPCPSAAACAALTPTSPRTPESYTQWPPSVDATRAARLSRCRRELWAHASPADPPPKAHTTGPCSASPPCRPVSAPAHTPGRQPQACPSSSQRGAGCGVRAGAYALVLDSPGALDREPGGGVWQGGCCGTRCMPP